MKTIARIASAMSVAVSMLVFASYAHADYWTAFVGAPSASTFSTSCPTGARMGSLQVRATGEAIESVRGMCAVFGPDTVTYTPWRGRPGGEFQDLACVGGGGMIGIAAWVNQYLYGLQAVCKQNWTGVQTYSKRVGGPGPSNYLALRCNLGVSGIRGEYGRHLDRLSLRCIE